MRKTGKDSKLLQDALERAGGKQKDLAKVFALRPSAVSNWFNKGELPGGWRYALLWYVATGKAEPSTRKARELLRAEAMLGQVFGQADAWDPIIFILESVSRRLRAAG